MKKRTLILSIVTGLVLVILFTVFTAGCGKKTPSTTAPDETTSAATEKTTAEPSSQPLSSSESEEITTQADTEEVTQAQSETTASPLPVDPAGWTGGVEMTVDPGEGIERITIQDKDGNDVELVGIRNYRWLEQPYDSTHWTIMPNDMELIDARCDASTLVMQGYAFDYKLKYTLAFRMLELDEDPRDYLYYPLNLYYTYQSLGYRVDLVKIMHQMSDSLTYFGSYEDFIGFTTRFSGDMLDCEDEARGLVIHDHAYISYNPGAAYNVMAIITIETTKEIYDRLASGKLEIDDEDTMLYALFEGAADKYPDVTHPLAHYLTLDVFDNGTWLYWDRK